MRKSMSPQKSKEQESPDFESEFKKIIKSIIKEENFVKQDELKEYVNLTIKELEPLIAKLIKRHLVELSKGIRNQFDDCPPPKIGEK